MPNKVDSKEVGLVAGLNLFHFFLGTKDLHYGLWTEGLEVNIRNLPEAQQRYSNFLIEHIPDDVSRILDVGCGAGGLASELRSRGYRVEGVSPSPLLSGAARDNAGEDFLIHEGRFEDVWLDKIERFDLVMFSESFQYINLNTALEKAQTLLRPGGYILICDFFKTGAPGKSVIGGGHSIDKFSSVLDASGLSILAEKDITAETAPNLDIVNEMGRDLFLPTFDLVGYAFRENHPWLAKIFQWKFKKKIRKIHNKYTSGKRNGEAFALHKIYKLYLLQLAEKP